MNPTRRTFLKALGLAGLLNRAIGLARAESAHAARADELGMLYDATRCVGCKACMVACKRVNAAKDGLAPERARFDADGLWDAPEDLSGSTRTVIKLARGDGTRWSYIKYACMHCQKPSCVSVCPVRAMTKDPATGIVEYRKSTCIGCRYCQVACPFNIPKFQWDRTIPQIVKCDLCRSTNLAARGLPACAEACPVGALTFGKRADLLREARSRLRQFPSNYVPKIYGEHEAGGTNLLYLAALPFSVLGLPDLPAQAPAELSERIQHTIYKGCVAPVVLFVSLCLIAVRNQKQRDAPEAHQCGSRSPEPIQSP
jgi:Fe-S-cluster-containing dehydrogenase component